MKQKIVFPMMFIFLALSIYSCDGDQGEKVAAESITVYLCDDLSVHDTIISLNETFELNFNQCKIIQFGGDKYQIELIAVEDDRCFLVDCSLCYGSLATITVRLTKNDEDANEFDMQILGCIPSNELFYGAYYNIKIDDKVSFRLGALSPYPEDEEHFNSIKEENYTTKIFLIKN